MSIKAMTYVWEHSAQRGSALLMMLAIADMANDDGDCWPGVSRLATKTRMSERNAQKTIRKLQDDGELLIFENQGTETAHGWTNRYRVVMNGVSLATPPTRKKPLRGERGDTSRGEPYDTPGVNGVTPKPSVEPKGETKELSKPNGLVGSKAKKETRPALEFNPLKNAIAAAFGWNWPGSGIKPEMTKSETGLIQAAAAELYDAGIKPEDIPALYGYCQQNFTHFKPKALCGVVSTVFGSNAQPTTPEDDWQPPAPEDAIDDEKREQLAAMFDELVKQKTGGR